MTEDQTKNPSTSSPRPSAGQAGQVPRPPIVVVMGHVDHGKTTLLDYIRKTNVASREAGGITQSIGAYEITHTPTNTELTPTDAEKSLHSSASSPRESAPSEGRRITFIDTPGHEAFSKMRARGAKIADLAILVVAADEGVKPQTIESIKILEETKTPYVVTITKIDKAGADIEKVKNDLTGAGVLLEGHGGKISYEPVSSKDGRGVDELLDLILLVAEVENLTCDPTAAASGFVLETRVDKQRGLEATVIVKNGTLRQGDSIATETASGRIKILENFLGEQVKELVPSAPALIIGFEKLPQVGEEFTTGVAAEAKAKKTASSVSSRTTAPAETIVTEDALNLVLKAEDAGSLEALTEIIKATITARPIRIVSGSVGEIVDNDVKLAISSGSLVIGFKSRAHKTAANMAEINGVKIITSDVIYELVKSIGEFLAETGKPATLGELEVLAIFNQSKLEKQLIGGRVVTGVMRNKASFEIKRGDSSTDSTSPSAVSSGPNGSPQASSGQAEVIGTGRILNLQQQKKDTNQVPEGNECGLLVNSHALIKVGDKLVIS